MKRFIIAIVTAIISVLPSAAQIHWGIKAGMNITEMKLNSSTFKPENRCGYFLGPHIDIDIPNIGLGFDAELLYENKSIGNKEANETLNYVDLPINIKYTFGCSEVISFYLATGPQFAWNLGDKSIFDNTYSLKSSLFEWNVGTGFTLFDKFRVGYTYNIPCGYTSEASISNLNFKNHTHQIHLTLLF